MSSCFCRRSFSRRASVGLKNGGSIRGRQPQHCWEVLVSSFTFPSYAAGFDSRAANLNPPALSSIFEAYTLVLGDLAVPVALALALLLLDVRRDRDDLQVKHPASEAALCAALLGIPIGGYILARFGSNMLAARYMLSVAIPFAVLFGWLFRQLAGRKTLAALLALAVLGGWSLNRGLKEAAHPSGLYERPHAVVVPKEDRVYQGLKIVFEDPVRYLQFFYYGTTEFQKNSTAIVDPPLAAKYTRIDAVDKNLVAAQPFFHFPAQDWKTFSRENRRFLLYWSPARFGWIRRNLEDQHARITLISIQVVHAFRCYAAGLTDSTSRLASPN